MIRRLFLAAERHSMNETSKRFRVITAGAAHVDLVVPLFAAYRQFYRLPPEEDGARAFLSQRVEKGEAVIFLALAENSPSATALGFTLLYPTFSSLSLKRLWILNDLYVVPEARKQGVAKALMEAARRLAVETGADSIALETAMDNHSARRLYEQLGYVRDVEFYRYALRI
jgi:GNAT superfamily N-acetyltransferase